MSNYIAYEIYIGIDDENRWESVIPYKIRDYTKGKGMTRISLDYKDLYGHKPWWLSGDHNNDNVLWYYEWRIGFRSSRLTALAFWEFIKKLVKKNILCRALLMEYGNEDKGDYDYTDYEDIYCPKYSNPPSDFDL